MEIQNAQIPSITHHSLLRTVEQNNLESICLVWNQQCVVKFVKKVLYEFLSVIQVNEITFYDQLMEIGDIFDHVHGQESLVSEKMNVTAFTELEHTIFMLNIALAGKNLFCVWNKAAASLKYCFGPSEQF